MIESKLEVTNLITPFTNAYKALSNEWKNLFDIGLTDYLHSQTQKYYFTNTFLHRGEKIVFNDIYYPLTASYKKKVTDFSDIENLFDDYQYITIVGAAGSGKTTLAKHIFLQVLEKRFKIPVILELRFLNNYDGDFEKLIEEKVLRTSAKPSKGILERALKSGKFVFILDGYDEVFSIRKQEINREIDSFVDAYPTNNFIITTRPGSGIEGFSRFYDFNVNELNNNEVEGFLDKLVENVERKQRILSIINDKNNNSYKEYLRNPLLLSMFILAFESHPEIPSKKSSFYKNVFDTLYAKHDGITKNSYQREKKTSLERDELEHILNIFCYLTVQSGKYAFTEEYLISKLDEIKKKIGGKYNSEDLIYDFRTTISIITLDGFEYRFPHRSIQDYFTAQFIGSLPQDNKIKAYGKLAEAGNLSNDSRQHLWQLCNEIDSYYFTTCFLIPQLKKIADGLDVNSKEKSLETFLSLFRPLLYQNKQTKKITLARLLDLPNSILTFCGISWFEEFKKHWESTGAIKLLDGRIKKTGTKSTIITFKKIHHHILLMGETENLIQRQRNIILEKIEELHKGIEKDQNILDDILDV